MCGIIGYTGKRQSLPILLAGLKALEYRGYDSAGVTVQGDEGLVTVKSKGRISELEHRLSGIHPDGTCGIGHTRWATHGEPSDVNAHPQTTPHLSLVHNGIIENEAVLGAELAGEGYLFSSRTDTERAAALLDRCYLRMGGAVPAMFEAVKHLRGSYAFGVIFADLPGKIYAVRKDSPLVIARTDDGAYLASDVTAILPYTREYFLPAEGIVAELCGESGEVHFFDAPGHEVRVPTEQVTWNAEEAQKGGYPCFMLKEIHEEPEVIRKTVSTYLSDGLPQFGTVLMDSDSDRLCEIRHIHMVACGTAMHACLVGKYLTEAWARIPTEVSLASEFRYGDPILSPDGLVILVSQSGETSDTLAALRHAKEQGIPTLGVVNVPGSAIAREADNTILTLAGPEIAVASTKAYSVQCAVMYLLAVRFALLSGRMKPERARTLCRRLLTEVPAATERALTLSDEIRTVASTISGCEHLFFIGRGLDYALAREASLKLKEISYLHSEAYAAGELKHGTISLVTQGVPVIALMTSDAVADKTLSAIREVLARGAAVTVIASEHLTARYDLSDCRVIRVPETYQEDGISPAFSDAETGTLFPVSSICQLLAYHTSDLRGLDADKPRNLAKSVTVE